jgi:hypothetical protein
MKVSRYTILALLCLTSLLGAQLWTGEAWAMGRGTGFTVARRSETPGAFYAVNVFESLFILSIWLMVVFADKRRKNAHTRPDRR